MTTKEHYLAYSYDSKDPQKFQSWLDEVIKLANQYQSSYINVATTSSRGQYTSTLEI